MQQVGRLLLSAGVALCGVFVPGAIAQQVVPDAKVTPHLRFGAEPRLATPLTRVRALVVLPNRRTIVLDDGTNANDAISLFDSTGRFLKQIAKSGKGPGELSVPREMGRYRDTLWVYEEGFPAEKVLLFGFDGTFLASRSDVDSRTPGRGATGLRGLRTPVALLEQGQSIRLFMAGVPSDPDPIVGLARFSASMTAVDTVASYNISRVHARYGRSWSDQLPNVVADYQLVAVQPGGTHLLVLDRSADRPALQLSRVALATNLREFVVQYAVPAQRLSSAFVDSAVRVLAETQYELMGPAQQFVGPLPGFIATIRQGTRIPQNAPLAKGLIAGMDGTSWVQLWGSGAQWVVFDSSGRPVQKVVLPKDTQLFAAERDYVWCVTKDAGDVPWITTFRITRR